MFGDLSAVSTSGREWGFLLRGTEQFLTMPQNHLRGSASVSFSVWRTPDGSRFYLCWRILRSVLCLCSRKLCPPWLLLDRSRHPLPIPSVLSRPTCMHLCNNSSRSVCMFVWCVCVDKGLCHVALTDLMRGIGRCLTIEPSTVVCVVYVIVILWLFDVWTFTDQRRASTSVEVTAIKNLPVGNRLCLNIGAVV